MRRSQSKQILSKASLESFHSVAKASCWQPRPGALAPGSGTRGFCQALEANSLF